ncbi:MAG: SCP2 sterol-binding domain-containing protein [Thermoplasmatota archaeon]
MLETLKGLRDQLNKKIENDEKVREVIASKDRTIVLEFTDEKTYVLEVKDGEVLEPREGTLEDPTLYVKTDIGTMNKLIEKKMNPLMAYAMRKIKVEGPIDDIMVLKDLF